MARANKLDPCLFCNEAPCVCNGPVRPAKKTKKVKSVTTENTEPVEEAAPAGVTEPAPKVDLKAAMKRRASAKPAPITKPVQQDIPSMPVAPAESETDTGQSIPRTVDLKAAMQARKKAEPLRKAEPIQARIKVREIPAHDDELSVALRILKPILHRTELAKYRDILVDPKKRAASWKKRNRG